ncbi:MAG: 30S ribosomal protein S2 [Pseudomonadota bacterium]
MRDMIESGLHFGHQTRRWNPKMRPFIYGVRGGVHIIDLQQTIKMFRRAYTYIVESVARGGHVLFVGTKRQAQDIVEQEARRAQMFFVAYRWIGGLLTNFKTVSHSLGRLKQLDARFGEEDGFSELKKKEVLRLSKERQRLEKYFGGVKAMKQLPSLLFVIDPSHETTAVKEAIKMNIPVIALIDTNCNPDAVDYMIPGNDDAIKSIQYVMAKMADACVEGIHKRMEIMGRYSSETEGLVASSQQDKTTPGPAVEYAHRKT